ncbi:MAG TPA: hypothetical protein VLJ14_06025, partial [Ktedonobacterales bacterium]|nr:hypothetical protein [Ktedonobacterales bacterium]
MPSIERHWRLLFVAALLLAAGVTFYLGTRLIAFDGAGGIHPSLNGLDWDTATTSLWFYGAAFWLWRLARRSRTHERARRRALAGDTLAIPPADIALDAGDEAPATQFPLVVSWQLAHTGCRATLWRTAVVLLAILLGVAAIIGVMLLQVMVAHIRSLAVILGTMALLTIAGYVLIARLIRSLPRSTGSRADTIITGEQGITQRRPGKPDLLIPWDQARLLEVWDTRPYTGGRQHWRGYTLYSAAARIEWQEFPASYPPGHAGRHRARRADPAPARAARPHSHPHRPHPAHLRRYFPVERRIHPAAPLLALRHGLRARHRRAGAAAHPLSPPQPLRR